ncbi:MAG: winged helix-turn-helix domain-containing protein [Mangrovibacterium sp.]
MIKNKIGINAGKIWLFLDQNGESSIAEVMKSLAMSSADVRMALGWLAREDKVYFFNKKNGYGVVLQH